MISTLFFKLRGGASMSTFLGRSVSQSVGPSVCLSVKKIKICIENRKLLHI